MGKEDRAEGALRSCRKPKSSASPVEAVNHRLLSRDELRQYVADNQIAEAVSILQDVEAWS